MKKKTVRSKSASTSSRRSSSSSNSSFLRKVLLVTTFFLVATLTLIWINKPAFDQAIARSPLTKGMYAKGTVSIPTLSDAKTYNIYYKEAGAKDFINAASGVSPDASTYTIAYLRKDARYQYRFAAVDATGREYLFSEILPLTNIEPM